MTEGVVKKEGFERQKVAFKGGNKVKGLWDGVPEHGGREPGHQWSGGSGERPGAGWSLLTEGSGQVDRGFRNQRDRREQGCGGS